MLHKYVSKCAHSVRIISIFVQNRGKAVIPTLKSKEKADLFLKASSRFWQSFERLNFPPPTERKMKPLKAGGSHLTLTCGTTWPTAVRRASSTARRAAAPWCWSPALQSPTAPWTTRARTESSWTKRRTFSLASHAPGGGAKKRQTVNRIKKKNEPQYSQSITITPITHAHTHRGACRAAGTASIQNRKSSEQISITQQGGMMQLPIRSSAGGRVTVRHSRDENRERREKEGGREEEEGYWEAMGEGDRGEL